MVRHGDPSLQDAVEPSRLLISPPGMPNNPKVHAFFDPKTSTASYLVADPATGRAAAIDSVLDFDAATGAVSYASADSMVETAKTEGYAVDWILETHAHADHLTAAHYLKRKLGGQIAIGERISEVQQAFARAFGPGGVPISGEDGFDRRWRDGETFRIGSIEASVLATPGHTPADVTYVVGDAVFVGDTLFMPDYGTARCDFPGGDAGILFDSVQRLFALPEATRMFLCHDYPPAGRGHVAWETTVGAQRRGNIHVRQGISREAFIALRRAKDAGLPAPKLIIPSLQVNVRAGMFPSPEADGSVYLKIPVGGAFSGVGARAREAQ